MHLQFPAGLKGCGRCRIYAKISLPWCESATSAALPAAQGGLEAWSTVSVVLDVCLSISKAVCPFPGDFELEFELKGIPR